jgi:predicted membrane-bound spermidine synthase
MGGCVGALAASLILVPVLGVVQTCLAVALVAGVGALLSIYHPLTGSC